MDEWNLFRNPVEKVEKRVPVKLAVVIEDDTDIRELLGQMLQLSGYRPMLYSTAEDALTELCCILNAVVVNVLIVDLSLPKMSGIEFVEQLERRHKRTMPIILISAHNIVYEVAQEIRAEGAFRKPFRIAELVGTADRLIEEQRRL